MGCPMSSIAFDAPQYIQYRSGGCIGHENIVRRKREVKPRLPVVAGFAPVAITHLACAGCAPLSCIVCMHPLLPSFCVACRKTWTHHVHTCQGASLPTLHGVPGDAITVPQMGDPTPSPMLPDDPPVSASAMTSSPGAAPQIWLTLRAISGGVSRPRSGSPSSVAETYAQHDRRSTRSPPMQLHAQLVAGLLSVGEGGAATPHHHHHRHQACTVNIVHRRATAHPPHSPRRTLSCGPRDT